jgi:hypothetical protein
MYIKEIITYYARKDIYRGYYNGADYQILQDMIVFRHKTYAYNHCNKDNNPPIPNGESFNWVY